MRRTKINTRAVTITTVLAGFACGCKSTPSVTPLTAESFYGTQTPSADPVLHPQDRPGVIDYEGRGAPDSLAEKYRPLVLAPLTPISAVESMPTAPTSPPASPTTVPATSAAAQWAPIDTGVFQLVGFVVAEVNGKPIFADEVVKQLRPLLAAEAKKLDRDDFRKLAAEQLERQIGVLVNNEVWYAVAVKELPSADKEIARQMTRQWKSEEITKAGGSEEVARQRYGAQGVDFDEEAQRKYRANLMQVFSHRKINPLVRVTADDIREYYNRNVSEFTTFGQVTFRLIKVDPKQRGGRDAAERAAREVRDRASREDFAKLASSDVNDNANNRPTGGLVENMKKDSYVLEKVERAVWATDVGGITDVIADGPAFYIAKVEAKQEGSVKPFGDLSVQNAIRQTLQRQQYTKQYESYRNRLVRQAVTRGGNEAERAVALDMIMQNYDAWAAAVE